MAASHRLLSRLPLLLLALPVLALLVSPAGAGLVISQEMNENDVNTGHTVAAFAEDDTLETPLIGVSVVFQVLSGPNAGTEGTCSDNTNCSTDSSGVVSFTYLGDGGPGIDVIEAFYVAGEADTVRSNQIEKTWIAPNRPPVAICQDVSVPGGEECMEDVSIDNGSFDPDEDPITLVQEPAGPYGLGETVVNLIVTDDEGAADTCTAVVTVFDETPPEITVDLDRVALWPPNHKLVEVCATVNVTDNCDSDPAWVLSSATSSEGDEVKKGGGDGNTKNDIQGAGVGDDDTCLLLRAERRGNGNGRVYTLEYTATDASGNASTVSATVTVAHDQGGHAMAAEGRGLLDDSAVLRLVIPSAGGLNALRIDADQAYVGNQEGVVSPVAWRMQDVVGDGRQDLVLDYESAAVTVALAGSPEPVDLYYRTDKEETFLVRDISGLSEIAVPEASDGDAVVAGPGAVGPAQIEIFDVQGRMVRSFSRDLAAEPSGNLGWDERDSAGRFVPQGIYFYRIQTATQSFVRKITVVR